MTEYEYWLEDEDGREGGHIVYDRPQMSTTLAMMGVHSFTINELLDVSAGPKVGIPLQDGKRLWVAAVEEYYDDEVDPDDPDN